jgi:hypothetical protein
MQAAFGDLARASETLPCVQEGEGEAGIQKTGFTGSVGKLREELLEAGEVRLAQAAAGVSREASLLKGKRCRIGRAAFDQPPPEDEDPHLKIRSLLDEDVLLGGEEPEQVASADSIMTITQEIGSGATRDEIQLELFMVVPPVRTGRVGVTPRHTIEICREFEPLQHDDKK